MILSEYRLVIGTWDLRRGTSKRKWKVRMECNKERKAGKPMLLSLILLVLVYGLVDNGAVCKENVSVVNTEWSWRPGSCHLEPREESVSHFLPISKDWNKRMRSENGNGRERGNSLKFVHWNPGSAFLQNKMDEIEALVELEQPNILGISEANFNLNTPEYEVLIPNYKLVLPNISPSVNSVARTVLYVREDLQYKVRLDLMPVDSAVI